VSDGLLRYGKDKAELAKNPDSGRSFSIDEIMDIKEDFSNNGRDVDFSGEKNYPFPFKI
jgi:hypothetical protein